MLLGVACGANPPHAADPTEGETGTYRVSDKQTPAAIDVQTHEATATVVSIDSATRVVVLRLGDGSQVAHKLGPEVVNFDRIKAGDQVRATVVERTAVVLAKNGMLPPQSARTVEVTRAPKGSQPHAMVVETFDTAAKVLAVDRRQRTVTLETVDEGSMTVKVSDAVDLTRVAPGDSVLMRATRSYAIAVESVPPKPHS